MVSIMNSKYSHNSTTVEPVNKNGKLRKSELTKQAIVDAAKEFLWTRPFRELTVRELMSATGTSRPAFYQYFSDLHRLMEYLLEDLGNQILAGGNPWFLDEGDPITQLGIGIDNLVKVIYEQGPVIRAIFDAAGMDEKLETAWQNFVGAFDLAVCQKIQQHQAQGLIPEFDAMQVSQALNRMDVGVTVHQFGQRPRSNPDEVGEALKRIWIQTLYGPLAAKKESHLQNPTAGSHGLN